MEEERKRVQEGQREEKTGGVMVESGERGLGDADLTRNHSSWPRAPRHGPAWLRSHPGEALAAVGLCCPTPFLATLHNPSRCFWAP